MGDRISIQFVRNIGNNTQKSVVLFSQWDGESLLQVATNYLKELQAESKNLGSMPLTRLEPNTVMTDFVRFVTKDEDRIWSNYYLSPNELEGDNSDNGHFVIDVQTFEAIEIQ